MSHEFIPTLGEIYATYISINLFKLIHASNPVITKIMHIALQGVPQELSGRVVWRQRGPDWLGNAVESWVPLWPAHLLSLSLNLHDAAYFYLLQRVSQIIQQQLKVCTKSISF